MSSTSRRHAATGSYSAVWKRAFSYRGATALLALIVTFTATGHLVENRLLQVLVTLGAGFTVWTARELGTFYSWAGKSVAVKSAQKRGQQLPIVAASLIFCALVLWGLMSNLIDPQYGFSHYDYVPVVAAVFMATVLMPSIFATVSAAAMLLASRRAARRGVLATVFVGFFAIQVRLGIALRIPPGWDAQVVLDSATELAMGSSVIPYEDYFSQYPNNIMLVLALSRYFDFVMLFGVSDLMLAAVILNCVVLTLGAVLTYVVARRIGNDAIALFTLVPSFIFMVFSPWIMVVYSDTLGLLFPILLFYLYLIQADIMTVPGKGLVWVTMGVTAVIGYNLKPTVIFILLAIAFVSVLAHLTVKHTRGVLLTAVAGTAVVAGSFAGVSYALTSVEDASEAIPFDMRNNDNAFPLTHFLKMGAQANGGVYNPYYGSFYSPDSVQTSSTPPEARLELNFHAYVDRVQEMGASDYVSFLSRKLAWFLGDGSFFLWGEGIVAGQPFIADDPLSQDIQSYYGFEKENYGTLIGVWQAAWFVLLGLVALPLFLRVPSLFTRHATILRAALLGLFVFLLFFEARARYLYLYLPFFIILASLSADALSKRRRDDRPGAAESQKAESARDHEQESAPVCRSAVQ